MAGAPDDTSPPANPPAEDVVRSLAKLLDETGLSEIEIEEGGRRVRVARQLAAAAYVAPPSTPPPRARMGAAEPAADPGTHPGLVTSPMVGVAYRAAKPEAAPFVEVGSRVKAGDTLLLIEAMKTHNNVPAPHAGVVAQILFNNGEPVEFGAPLMIIEQGA